MSKTPLVSVIIIFLNAETFIQEAIESVFVQTYDNWELLLVDDGSTDDSTAIARRYAEQHPKRVHYLEHNHHQNHGMSASRNLGIAKANGQYIAFLDADDVWLPQILDEQVALLQAYPEAAMVYGPVQWWYSWTGKPEDARRDVVLKPGIPPNTLVQPPTLLLLFLRKEGMTPSGVLVRRVLIECVGGFEESFRGMYEDQAFCAKVCLVAPVLYAGACWYRYRQHASSNCAVGVSTGQHYTARRFFLNWLAEYLSTQGIWDAQVWQALQKELWPYRYPMLYRWLRAIRLLVRQGIRLLAQIGRWMVPIASYPWLRLQ